MTRGSNNVIGQKQLKDRFNVDDTIFLQDKSLDIVLEKNTQLYITPMTAKAFERITFPEFRLNIHCIFTNGAFS